MAYTAASQLASRILQNPSDSKVHVEWGKLASTYKPGDVVYQSAAGTWTKQASNAGNLKRTGVVLDKPHTSSTFGSVSIDTAYATTDFVPICTSGIVVASIIDQNGTIDIDNNLILSSTAGSLTIGATQFMTVIAARNMHAVVDDDVYTICGLGLFIFCGECVGFV